MVQSLGEALFLCDNWFQTLCLMVICLSLLIQKSFGISSWTLMEKLVYNQGMLIRWMLVSTKIWPRKCWNWYNPPPQKKNYFGTIYHSVKNIKIFYQSVNNYLFANNYCFALFVMLGFNTILHISLDPSLQSVHLQLTWITN